MRADETHRVVPGVDARVAWHDADASATASGVVIRTLDEISGTRAVEALMMRVWNTDRSGVPLTASTMRALAHAGNYVAGAFAVDDPERMVGCVVGFFAPPRARSMHSHVAAVDGSRSGSGVGAAMKLHQRAWCLERDTERMTWTFDPAISRNAYFNLHKLGATVHEYLEDFYGPMDDGLNAGSPSDRLLVEWSLAEPLAIPRSSPSAAAAGSPAASIVLSVGADGGPVSSDPDTDAVTLLVGLPRSIEAMRRDDPALAAAWRAAVRDSLAPLVASPTWRVTGFVREGSYVVERYS